MKRWQYKTLTYGWDDGRQDLVWMDLVELAVNTETVDRRLNELGNEGWELISIEKISDISHVAVSFYLKRPLEDDPQLPS